MSSQFNGSRPGHLLALLLVLCAPQTDAQTLRLSQLSNETTQASASVGDTLSLQIRAQLGSLSATGLTLFVRFSSTAFTAVDADGDTANGLQPFEPGSLFAGAIEFDNATVSDDELLAGDRLAADQLRCRSRRGRKTGPNLERVRSPPFV